MKISYDKIVLSKDLKKMTREIIDGVSSSDVPLAWTGIIVYHPATKSFYSTTSKEPFAYEEIIRKHLEPRWSKIAIGLRRLLARHEDFQFFVMPLVARTFVEEWLWNNGNKRISTLMGEGAEPDRVIWQVYSPYNRFTRYVSAVADAKREDVIKQANSGLAQWLGSPSKTSRHERLTMQVALRSRVEVNREVFEPTALVNKTNLLNGQPHNAYRSVCMTHNAKAIKDFILNTCF